MLEQYREFDREWQTGELEIPFGRGINFQIEVAQIDPILDRLVQSKWELFIPVEERWYRADGVKMGQCQFLVKDPDGYLLRLIEDLGNKKQLNKTNTMKKVKITVLKTTLDTELAKEYGVDGLSACPMLSEGDVFYADYAKPDGFCDEAWKAIYQYAFALAHGAEGGLFYYGDWIKKPGVAICSCNDGLRPVIFKLEATEQTASIDYDPVR